MLFSAFDNLPMSIPPLFTLQVYDRVLMPPSTRTLVALTLVMAFVMLILGLLDHPRGRMMARAGTRLRARLDPG